VAHNKTILFSQQAGLGLLLAGLVKAPNCKRYVYKDVMRKFIIILSLLLSPLLHAQDLHLSNATEIKAALEMNKSLNGISKKVTSCIQAGKEHLECMCSNRNEIVKFNDLVKSTFHKYPLWVNVRTLNFPATDVPNVVVNPSALLAQANQILVCE
jgi:hypothetical protein